MLDPILPGATIGVFGSGQLGRMMALAAKPMGYRLATFSPESDSPTGQVADREIVAAYDDEDAVRDFVASVDVVTFEFENVNAVVADLAVEAGVPVHPSGDVLRVAQNRILEKSTLRDAGLPVTPFVPITSQEDLNLAANQLDFPLVLKTASSGYDGKGQVVVIESSGLASAWEELGRSECVAEMWIDFEKEISVVAVRGVDGGIVDYGAIENSHDNHILDVSISPARVSDEVAAEAQRLAYGVLEALDVVGVTTVEFFLAGEKRLFINEIAPRPHNSGHLTIEAAATSQFEQHIRAICGLPFGSTVRPRPAAMANLLGDLWYRGTPNWAAALAHPDVKLHLYGKHEARPGRKMGHLTVVARQTGASHKSTDIAAGVQWALDTVTAARTALADGSRHGGARASGSHATAADIGV